MGGNGRKTSELYLLSRRGEPAKLGRGKKGKFITRNFSWASLGLGSLGLLGVLPL